MFVFEKFICMKKICKKCCQIPYIVYNPCQCFLFKAAESVLKISCLNICFHSSVLDSTSYQTNQYIYIFVINNFFQQSSNQSSRCILIRFIIFPPPQPNGSSPFISPFLSIPKCLKTSNFSYHCCSHQYLHLQICFCFIE